MEISQVGLTLRDKTEVHLSFEGEQGGVTEEILSVFHKPLFDSELIKELFIIEADSITDPPKVTRQLLLLDAQSPDTKDNGAWARWTPETLARLGVPFQQVVARQVLAPVMRRLEAVLPAPPVAEQPAPSTAEAAAESTEGGNKRCRRERPSHSGRRK